MNRIGRVTPKPISRPVKARTKAVTTVAAKPAPKPVASPPTPRKTLLDFFFKRTPPAPPPKPKEYGFMNGPGVSGPLTWEMRDHSFEQALAKASVRPGSPGADIVWVPAGRGPNR